MRPDQARDGAAGEAQDRAALGRLADDMLPALVARLGASGLGELEVRGADWSVRLRREPQVAAGAAAPAGSMSGGAGRAHRAVGESSPGLVRSPAVGYFVPRSGLAVGLAVQAGDGVGHVEVLGLRQEVPVPVDGIVGRIFVAAGQAVEYGQELLRVDPVSAPAPTDEVTEPAPERAAD